MVGLQISDSLELWHRYRGACIVLIATISLLSYVWCRSISRWGKSHSSLFPNFSTRISPIREENLPETDKPVELDRLSGSSSKISKISPKSPKRVGLSSKRVSRSQFEGVKSGEANKANKTSKIQPLVFYFSLTDSTRRYTTEDVDVISKSKIDASGSSVLTPKYYDIASIDHEDFFEQVPRTDGVDNDIEYFYVLLIPSYNIDTALDVFLSLLKETHNDFRIDTAPLAALAGYSVFGFGDSEGWPTVPDGFCTQAIETDKWMAKLSGKKRAYPLGLGDVKSDVTTQLRDWTIGVFNSMEDIVRSGHLGEGAPGSGEALESDDEEIAESEPAGPPKRRQNKQATGIGDLEDIGSKNDTKAPLPVDFTTSQDPHAPKAMVPVASPTYAALTKQGYTIIGTHSGVKICRWTKSALRGRGSCYKFSFYGIQSHLCMETTPSLSCSNKCVFCWRHGTNPVGTTWRWQVDPPDQIFAGAKAGHYQKIKMMRGVPGVRAERFQEAMKIRHCALSLVGEPIFYPHINEFLALLHKERISSFLVCNAQHPDQLAALKSVTQLYVSIDASNADSLRRIDRPLHRDYWARFLRCLDILSDRRFRMRTVFRLTLVKGFNIDEEVEGYADLIARGLPCFVEIKGVTYCGTSTSKSAGLTMQNVPFYAEIQAFVTALDRALEKRGLGYGIAAEHAHSCCVLIASWRFWIEGKWHTLIDYGRYFECLESRRAFTPEDYMGPATPEWATWGRGGFDPRDERVDRKGRPIEVVK